MPLLLKAAKAITDRLPKVISPGAHAAIDYGTAATFLAMSAVYWRRHRPAAVSAMICGLSESLVAMMTDYPGGLLSLEAHARIDVGLALLTATIPEFMKFEDRHEARFFNLQALAMASVAGLTDFKRTGERKQLQKTERAA